METKIVGKISSPGINRNGKKYPEPTWEQLAELVGKPVTLGVPTAKSGSDKGINGRQH